MSNQVPERLGCSLSAEELSSRVLDWRAVVDDALLTRAALPGGVRVSFRAGSSIVHDLVELVLAEQVDFETAASAASNRHDFEIAVQQALRQKQVAESAAAPAGDEAEAANAEEPRDEELLGLRLASP